MQTPRVLILEARFYEELAEAMLRGEVKEGEPILVVRNGDKLEFKSKSPTAESGVTP